MMVENGIIFPYDGTHASIVTSLPGWSRVTSLDASYPKAWGAENPGATGGSNTHSHSATDHGHTMNSHSHSVYLGLGNESTGAVDGSPSGNGVSRHSHSATTITSPSGGSLQNTSVTWSSINSEPPYYKVIFVTPSGTGMAPVSNGMLAYYNGSPSPSGWLYCDGTSGTPDLREKYLKGADALGDAGTGSGATSHSHTITHGHTANSHTHSGTSPVNNNENERRLVGGSSGDIAKNGHTHSITLDATTDTVSNYTNTAAGSTDTVEPSYKKMGILKYNGGGLQKGLIAMMLGTSPPIGWVVCDGTNSTVNLQDYFIKVGNSLSDNGVTGGANTHTHSSVSHAHTTTGSHTHTVTVGAQSTNGDRQGSATNGYCVTAHDHGTNTANTISSTSADYSSTSIDCSTDGNQPVYTIVSYIEYRFSTGGALFFANL